MLFGDFSLFQTVFFGGGVLLDALNDFLMELVWVWLGGRLCVFFIFLGGLGSVFCSSFC